MVDKGKGNKGTKRWKWTLAESDVGDYKRGERVRERLRLSEVMKLSRTVTEQTEHTQNGNLGGRHTSVLLLLLLLLLLLADARRRTLLWPDQPSFSKTRRAMTEATETSKEEKHTTPRSKVAGMVGVERHDAR